MIKIRQLIGRIWIGRIKVVFARESTYFGYVNFTLMLSTFYAVKGYEYAPVWIFILLALIGLVSIGLFDYFLILPSEQAFVNEQAVKHQNPLYEEVLLMKEEIKHFKKELIK